MTATIRTIRAVKHLIGYETRQRLYYKKELCKFWQERKMAYMRAYVKKCIFTIRYFDKELKSDRLWLKQIKAEV